MGIEPSCRAGEKGEFWQKGVLVWQEVSLSDLFLADRKTKISFSVLLQSRFFSPQLFVLGHFLSEGPTR